ncbi:MAG: hypothetical protein ACYDCK_11880 [Thermoplasmatota archaeon]
MHVHSLDKLQRHFESEGQTVTRAALVAGAHDVARQIPLLAESASGEWTFVFVHDAPVTAADVIDAHVAAVDCSARALIASARGAEPGARMWAARFRVGLVDVEPDLEAIPVLSDAEQIHAADEEAAHIEPEPEVVPQLAAVAAEPPVALAVAVPVAVEPVAVAPSLEPPAADASLADALAYFDAVQPGAAPPAAPAESAAAPKRALPWDVAKPRFDAGAALPLPWKVPFVSERAPELTANEVALGGTALWASKVRLSGLRASLAAEGAESFGETVAPLG